MAQYFPHHQNVFKTSHLIFLIYIPTPFRGAKKYPTVFLLGYNRFCVIVFYRKKNEEVKRRCLLYLE